MTMVDRNPLTDASSSALSGRRDSNPRPTAWKAVTLPTELLPHDLSTDRHSHVGRGGFEPPKVLDRQIYSLLRLTASLPARLDYWRPNCCAGPGCLCPQELAMGLEPATC